MPPRTPSSEWPRPWRTFSAACWRRDGDAQHAAQIQVGLAERGDTVDRVAGAFCSGDRAIGRIERGEQFLEASFPRKGVLRRIAPLPRGGGRLSSVIWSSMVWWEMRRKRSKSSTSRAVMASRCSCIRSWSKSDRKGSCATFAINNSISFVTRGWPETGSACHRHVFASSIARRIASNISGGMWPKAMLEST